MIDYFIFQKINGLAGKSVCIDSLGIFFARYFEYFLVLFLLLFLVKSRKLYWPMVIKAFGAAILSRLVIANIIRWLIHRPRPFVENEVNLLLDKTTQTSFPSGHASFYFALATVVYSYNKKLGLLFFIGAFLVSFVRVFAGVHWPSDILAGAIVGIFSGWLLMKIFKK